MSLLWEVVVNEERVSFEQLVRRSHSPNADVRNAAMDRIRALSDEDLLPLLGNHSMRCKPTVQRFLKPMNCALIYSVTALGFTATLSRISGGDPHLRWLFDAISVCIAIITLPAACLGGATWLQLRTRRRDAEDPGVLRPKLAALLLGRTDRRFLPFLLSEMAAHSSLFERNLEFSPSLSPAMPFGNAVTCHTSASGHRDVRCRGQYRAVLKGILSQLEPIEKMEFSAAAHCGLLLLLQRPEEDVKLTICILERLEEWGDLRTVPALKRLLRAKRWYVGSDQVETAARLCLEKIEARLLRQKQGDTLLRSAQSSKTEPPNSLLRPATGQSENSPEQLLRPAVSVPAEQSDRVGTSCW